MPYSGMIKGNYDEGLSRGQRKQFSNHKFKTVKINQTRRLLK